jgi:hypothetical protein
MCERQKYCRPNRFVVERFKCRCILEELFVLCLFFDSRIEELILLLLYMQKEPKIWENIDMMKI